MIDSKKIISYIKKHINPYGKPFEGTVFEFGNKVMDYIKAMEKQPKTDWIPCEERLPEKECEMVLVCLSEGEIMVGYYTKNFGWYTQFCAIVRQDIRAWQPLPQPYKKEGAETDE